MMSSPLGEALGDRRGDRRGEARRGEGRGDSRGLWATEVPTSTAECDRPAATATARWGEGAAKSESRKGRSWSFSRLHCPEALEPQTQTWLRSCRTSTGHTWRRLGLGEAHHVVGAA